MTKKVASFFQEK